MKNDYKKYLGDGVYVHHNGWEVVLTTEDGKATTNTVFLEPLVLKAFQVWLKKLEESNVAESRSLASRGDPGD